MARFLTWMFLLAESALLADVVFESVEGALPGATNDLVHNGELFLGVGDEGRVVRSSNGFEWTTSHVPTADNLSEVIWTGDRFVAVGELGRIHESVDGRLWQTYSIGAAMDLVGATAWTGGVIVAGPGVVATTSGDGLWDWSNPPEYVSGPCVWTGQRLILGGWGAVQQSTDAVDWEWVALPTSDSIAGLAWDGSTVVAVDSAGRVFTNPGDGTPVWISRGDVLAGGNTSEVNYSGGQFWVFGTTAEMARSADGISWTSTGQDAICGYAIDRMVATIDNTNLGMSREGVLWMPEANEKFPEQPRDSHWDGDSLLVVGNEGAVFEAIDEHFFFLIAQTLPNDLYGIASSGSGMWVAVGEGGLGMFSSDKETWSPVSLNTGQTMRSVAWDGERFIAVGNAGAIATSEDGTSWTPRTSGTTKQLNAVEHAAGGTVIVGDDGTVLRSTDEGMTWPAIDIGTTQDLDDLAWSGARFVAITSSRAYYSDDGVTWDYSSGGGSILKWTGDQFVSATSRTFRLSDDGINWTAQLDREFGTVNTVALAVRGDTGSVYGFLTNGTLALRGDDRWEWVGHRSVSASSGILEDGTSLRTHVGGDHWYSEDGEAWTMLSGPGGGGYSAMVVDGTYYYGTQFGGILRTTDFEAFTTVASFASRETIHGLYHDANVGYLAAGNNGFFARSFDGENWFEQDLGVSSQFYGFERVGSRVYLLGATNLSTTDGFTWSTVPNNGALAMATDGTRIVGMRSFLETSENDGSTWIRRPFANATDANADGVWTGTEFLFADTNDSWVSSDGQSWRRHGFSGAATLDLTLIGDHLYASGTGPLFRADLADRHPFFVSGYRVGGIQGEPLVHSLETMATAAQWTAENLPDGLTMTSDGRISGTPSGFGSWVATITGVAGDNEQVGHIRFDIAPGFLAAIGYGFPAGGGGAYLDGTWTGSKYLFVGENGQISETADGLTWTNRRVPTSDGFTGVAVGDSGVEVVTTLRGNVYRREPPGAFIRVFNEPSGALLDVTRDGSRFICVGAGGGVYLSPDGWEWDAVKPTTVGLTAVASSGSVIVAVGETNGVRVTSFDGGQNWVESTAGVTGFTDVVWTGDQFIAFAEGFLRYVSANGTSWTAPTGGDIDADIASASAAGGRVFAVGEAITWTENGGTSWSEVPDVEGRPQRAGVVVAGPSGAVAVGGDGTRYRYVDGDGWEQVLPRISSNPRTVRSDGRWFFTNPVNEHNAGSYRNGESWDQPDSAVDWDDVAAMPDGTGILTGTHEQPALGAQMMRYSPGMGWTDRSDDLPGWDTVITATLGSRFVVAGAAAGLDETVGIVTTMDFQDWDSFDTSDAGFPVFLDGTDDGLILVIDDNGALSQWFSSDGLAWSAGNLPVAPFSVASFGGAWFAVMQDGSVWRSTDGLDWSAVLPAGEYNSPFDTLGISASSFGVITFGTTDRTVRISVDGVNWMERTVPRIDGAVDGILATANGFLVSGNSAQTIWVGDTYYQPNLLAHSVDGGDWTVLPFHPFAPSAVHADGDDLIVSAVGLGGLVFPNQAVSRFAVSAQPLPGTGGSVTGGGTYFQGEHAELRAESLAGYQFYGWSPVDGITDATGADAGLTVTVDQVYSASFIEESSAGYPDWARGEFPGVSVTLVGPYADYDGDGIDNFAEFALNGDPNASADSGIRELDATESGLRLQLSLADGQADVGVEIHVSDDLVSWGTTELRFDAGGWSVLSGDLVIISAAQVSGGAWNLEFDLGDPGAGVARFARVRVKPLTE